MFEVYREDLDSDGKRGAEDRYASRARCPPRPRDGRREGYPRAARAVFGFQMERQKAALRQGRQLAGTASSLLIQEAVLGSRGDSNDPCFLSLAARADPMLLSLPSGRLPAVHREPVQVARQTGDLGGHASLSLPRPGAPGPLQVLSTRREGRTATSAEASRPTDASVGHRVPYTKGSVSRHSGQPIGVLLPRAFQLVGIDAEGPKNRRCHLRRGHRSLDDVLVEAWA